MAMFMIHFPSTIDIKITNVLEHIFAYVCTEKGCFPKHPFSNLLHFSRKNFLLHFPFTHFRKIFLLHFPFTHFHKNFLLHFPFTHFCKNFLLHFPFTHFCKNFLLHFHSSHFRKIFLLHLSYTYTIKQFPPHFYSPYYHIEVPHSFNMLKNSHPHKHLLRK